MLYHELKVNSVVIVSSYNLWKTSILTLLRELNNWLGNANQQLIYVFIYLYINTYRTVDNSQQIRLSEVALLHVVHSRERSTSDTFALLAILVLVSARVEPGTACGKQETPNCEFTRQLTLFLYELSPIYCNVNSCTVELAGYRPLSSIWTVFW